MGRDVKPENLLVRMAGKEQGSGDGGAAGSGLHVRLIDFGSAIDAHSLRHLYGPGGPSDREQTPEYAPPEAVLGRWGCHVVKWFLIHLGQRMVLMMMQQPSSLAAGEM